MLKSKDDNEDAAERFVELFMAPEMEELRVHFAGIGTSNNMKLTDIFNLLLEPPKEAS